MRFRLLGSGSSGNATLVEAGDTRILLDAGIAARPLAERLESAGVDPASIAAVFLSHEHEDHAAGATAFSRKWGARICGSRGTYAARGLGAETIAGYDVALPGVPRHVGALTVLPIAVPHDAAGPLAFVVTTEAAALGHATDVGHLPRGLGEAFRTCDTVLVESNYEERLLLEGSYPWSVKERILGPLGHLSNAQVARYLAQALGHACRLVVLAHVSQQNNDRDLARAAAEEALRARGRTEVRVEVAAPDGMDWIDVLPPAARTQAPRQLRLW
jgi:phosphoribosyl 1,2-cyclic phosphodiesterase